MSSEIQKPENTLGITRRAFVRSATVAGAGIMMGLPAWAQDATDSEKVDELAIAIIGPGSQGRNLLTKALKIPGIRFVAVSDIWPYHQKYAQNILKKYDQPVSVYEDYREMLDKEPQLDAVIIASPDHVHAEQTVACLKAGKHVYCEKEMSNTLAGAQQMVETARDTGKLLQIGHQRRSNPRYWHALKLIEKDKVLGRVTHVYGQWNRAQLLERGWPPGKELDADALQRYGYEDMDQFCNWRWYRKFSGGAMADLGSHQVDVFGWFLKCQPKAVLADGGLDYYQKPGREWYDNVMAIYEFPAEAGLVRGMYQVLNTTSHGGFFETFMGDEGSMVISEDPRKGLLYREVHAKTRQWEDESEKIESMGRDAIELKVGETLAPDGTRTAEAEQMLAEIKKPIHQLHLENFFNAIRKGTPLSCPPEVAYETAVAVFAANDAVEAQRRIEIKPDAYKV